jgi:hypothetical protein
MSFGVKKGHAVPSKSMRMVNIPLSRELPARAPSVNGVWKTSTNVDLRDPALWGPSLWFSLHNGSFKYPENPDEETKAMVSNFIMGLPYMIPCVECASHAKEYISDRAYLLPNYTANTESLSRFFVDFHNTVNARLGKPQMSYEVAKQLYSGRGSIRTFSY